MKVLMLNPPFLPRYSRQSRSPCVTKSDTVYYPYYLAYATGAVEQAGFDVKLVDAVANDWTHEETIDFVKKSNPQLVVIDTSTASIKNDVDIGARIKEKLPETHVSLVGTFPTNMTQETFAMSASIDSVCIKEYDLTVRDLASVIENNKSLSEVAGLVYRENGNLIRNKPRPLMTTEELDKLPFASEIYLKHFGKEGIKKYFYASVTWPEIMLLSARGCPWNCSFCNIPMKQSYRPRSIENVIDEFEFVQNEMPFVNEIMWEDDTLPAVKIRTIKLCDELIKRKIKVKWSCNARVTTDYETMKKMRQAGCRLFCVGFESATQEILDKMIKQTPLQRQYDFVKEARQIGLKVNGCFIFGLNGDTPETMMKTIEMAKELNPNSAQFYPLQVYPGTQDYNWAKQNGLLVTQDWREWITEDGLHTTTVSRPGLTPDDVRKWCNKARLAFYTNPKFLLKMFMQAASDPTEAVRIIKASKVLFKHITRYIATNEAKPKIAQ